MTSWYTAPFVLIWERHQPRLAHSVAKSELNRVGCAKEAEGMDDRPHILVVEDEATQRQLLVDYLSKQGFRVSGANGGAALRKIVERELPAPRASRCGFAGRGWLLVGALAAREKSAYRHHYGDGRYGYRGPGCGARNRCGRLHRQAVRAARVAGASEERPAARDRSDRDRRTARTHGSPRARSRKARAGRSGRRQRGDTDR